LGVLLTLLILLAACNGSEQERRPAAESAEPPAEPVTIRLGHWGATAEILYVMQHLPDVAPNQGTWYEIELTRFGDPPAIPRNIAAGALEGGTIASLDAASALSQGDTIVLTGTTVEDREGWGSVTWLVRNDSGITQATDLRGQTLGTPGPGGSLKVVQDYWLAEGGLAPGDYEEVVIPFPQMADALRAGQIAAAPLPPPFLQQALATGEFRPLFALTDIRPRLVSVLFGLNREFVSEQPEVAERFMQDWATVAQWIADPANREQVLEANHAATEIPVEVLGRYLLTDQDGYRPPNGALDPSGLQETWDFYREEGAFQGQLDVDDHVIDELLPPPA
jgi:ABC-type nitrate/sulfonate/bicarbonate transport system substrate-binding protein